MAATERAGRQPPAIGDYCLLDVAFTWSDLPGLRHLVAGHCAIAGMTVSRRYDFVLAIHEISANAIMHGGAGGRLVLRLTASGLECVITDSPAAPGRPAFSDPSGLSEPEPAGADTGRGLWLAAKLADELTIVSRPDRTVVTLRKLLGR